MARAARIASRWVVGVNARGMVRRGDGVVVVGVLRGVMRRRRDSDP